MHKANGFFVSDSTGITAPILSLLSKFDEIEFGHRSMPYIDTPEKARDLITEISAAEKLRPAPTLHFSLA